MDPTEEPYHQGIAARKAGLGRHENPYIGRRSFLETVFEPLAHLNRDWWNQGWDAEDRWQKEKATT